MFIYELHDSGKGKKMAPVFVIFTAKFFPVCILSPILLMIFSNILVMAIVFSL